MEVKTMGRYVVIMGQYCTYATENGRLLFHIDKDSPFFDQFEAEFNDSMFSEKVVKKYIKLTGGKA